MHKLIITAFTAVLLAGGAAQAKEWTKIRIGVEGAYPPFSSMTEDGELQGFDIDIAHALCAQINAECTLVPQDWDGIIPALLARKYDAIIASMSITEERKKKVNFTNKYYQTPARFARRKGSGIEVSAADLKGRKVGVQRATIHDGFLTDFLNTEQGGDWEFVGPPYTDVKYFGEGAGIAVRKRDNDLREQLNAAIDAIRANGVYRQINEKYFDFDIYGN